MSSLEDALYLRDVLGRYATGVAIVTARTRDGAALGLTVNSFASVSLDPPIVLWSLRKAARAHADFLAATHFAVNVLGAEHEALARRFAGPAEDRFGSHVWQDGLGGAPVLADALARFECEREASLDMGDHTVLFGRVRSCSARAGAPLVFHRGRFARVCAALDANCTLAA